MPIKPGLRDFLWMAIGAAALLVVVAVVLRFNPGQNAAEQLAWQVRKLEVVDRMSVALESAAEAEKSAVLAITDEDSRSFADQARAASATVEEGRTELAELLQSRGARDESDLLAKFDQVFADFRRVDEQVLALAVKNTNLKAYALAYGPAADALRDMEQALARVVAVSAPLADAGKVTTLALGADLAALHVQTLLPPHIAEEAEAKMATLEGDMAEREREVREDLDGLAAIAALHGSPDLAAAAAAWARYLELKAQILALSRENTNVLSLALSLSRKRQVTLACREALADLREAIKAEPIVGVSYGRPVMPR